MKRIAIAIARHQYDVTLVYVVVTIYKKKLFIITHFERVTVSTIQVIDQK